MQVGLQHGMPTYLTYADACVDSGDAAEQVGGGAIVWTGAGGWQSWLAEHTRVGLEPPLT